MYQYIQTIDVTITRVRNSC